MKRIDISFLSQPYPYYFAGLPFFVVLGSIFMMTLGFNYFFFEPFDVYVPEHKMDFFWISVIHSITPIVILLVWYVLSLLISDLEDRWTVGKEILFLCLLFFMVGVVQFLIRDLIYDNPNNWSWHYLIEEVRNTFLVGSLFTLILIPLNYNRLNRQHQLKAEQLPVEREESIVVKQNSVFIQTQVRADEFTMSVDELVYARAERNYVEIYSFRDQNIHKELKRIAIKDLMEQLQIYPFIARTHRSYLVNLQQIKSIRGNAQGYQLQLKHTEEMVPVSRTLIADFESQMASL
ncbi:LytTR family transcriptional regulator [Reichenbachiella agarivorans]|uniref:LytTR family transcriptional regulator n=1 Tax=Reichenbachiella agarivorans TaxID=2979464 RepID=A0ABY6CUB1_9BACT|nr:LytTR family DNA-binding domain-containing protein [Reichenbachiella agarivorans]UXP31830.1 LytTR family transcriptional regulator [Reichenbachiella agarivorans]